VADRLVAWLYGTPVAVLIRGPEFRIRLEWHPEGIERWGLGSLALSVGLPIGAPMGPRDLRGLDFFENMLPEGPALDRIAALAGVRPAPPGSSRFTSMPVPARSAAMTWESASVAARDGPYGVKPPLVPPVTSARTPCRSGSGGWLTPPTLPWRGGRLRWRLL
jgi:hypothetical protein